MGPSSKTKVMEHIQPLTASQACRAPMAQQKKGRSMRPFCLQGLGTGAERSVAGGVGTTRGNHDYGSRAQIGRPHRSGAIVRPSCITSIHIWEWHF
jgi:hypothetical protein